MFDTLAAAIENLTSGSSAPNSSAATSRQTSPEQAVMPTERERGVRPRERVQLTPEQVRRRTMSRARTQDRRTGREKGLSGKYWSTPTGKRRDNSARVEDPDPEEPPADPDNYSWLQAIALDSNTDTDSMASGSAQPPALWTAAHQRERRKEMRQQQGLAYSSDSEEQQKPTEKNRDIAIKQHERRRERHARQAAHLAANRGHMKKKEK